MNQEELFKRHCRENTGKQMCDSGDFYGRHYEKPPIAEDAPEIRNWGKGCSATLETAVFLAERMDVRRDWQDKWQARDATQEDNMDWFESGQKFMGLEGYHSASRGNTYNGENDLSQSYVWDVFLPNDGKDKSDWLYEPDAVVLIHIHCGCDERSGHASPLFCKSKGDYCIPTDLCAEYKAGPVKTGALIDSDDVDWEHYQAIDEKWSAGYSRYPYGALEADVAEWHEDTRTRDSVEVTLKSGERILVTAYAPYFGG